MRRRFGIAFLLLGLASFTTAATTAAVTLPLATAAFDQDAPSPTPEPKDEVSHWKAIEDAVSSGRFWQPDTLALIQRFVKEYPASGRVGTAKWHLVQHENHQGRRAQAVELCREIVEKHPGSTNAADAQLVIAQWLMQQRQKDDAKEAFKKLFKQFPTSAASRNGLWQYWNLVDKHFQFGVSQSYTEGQQVVVRGSLRNIDRIDYRLYRLDPESLRRRFDEESDPGSIQDLVASVPPESRKKLKEWTDEPEVGRRWKQVEVKPEISEPGFYVLEAEHDEIPVQVGIVVARYGLIVKSAPNRSVVFAVDRRTGRAIEGMELRFAQGKERFSGRTDAEGLFVIDRGVNGSVVGIKDGDFALSNLWTQQDGDEARGYVLTDRPIYRPNQVVHFKVTHRTLKRGKPGMEADELLTPADKDVTITIHDPRHNVIFQKPMKTGANGAVSGQFQLGDEPPLGHYSIASSLGGYGQFRVEEYRKPEYEVKVRFQGAPYAQGDDLKGEISVDYYFGSPVVEADVAWELYKAPYYPMHWHCFRGDWDLDDSNDGDDEDDDRPRRYYGHGERVAQGKGRTDKAGRLSVTAGTAKDGKDAQYTLIAKVVDQSRREVAGQASAKVTRAQIELQASASKYLYRPGDSVIFKVRAVDLEGKPVADQEISITASTAAWRRRERDPGYEYGEFFVGKARTDAQGVADFTFPADQLGCIRVRAVTADRRGTEVAAEHWTWVSDRSWSADFSNFTGLDVIPDRTTYGPGDQAQVLITSQHRNVHVLFTVECGAIYRQEVVTVTGHTAVVEVPIDVRAFSPNVYFSATALVGNEFVAKSKSVAVPPADRLLSVKVSTDKTAYRPREPMKVTVEVRDAAGRPAQAELAISMVDESIYALQTEFARDIRKFFYAKRWNRTATSTSMHFYDMGRAGWGAKDEAPATTDAARGADPQGESPERNRRERGKSLKADHNATADDEAATEVRGHFPDTMYWAPMAVTGADGTFTFTASAPDSLTTWRTTVRGMTADSKVGQARLETIVRKEVIIRLEAPRFFTQNDVCIVSGVVHNYRDDVSELRVALEASGVELVGETEHRVHVAKGADKRIDWRISAKRPGEAKLTARAMSPKESDAMQLAIPVLPHGTPRYEAKSGLSEAGAKTSVTLPASAIPEATELTIVTEPSVAAQITTSLEYLAGYPYGCVEQTMSRFLPSVTAGRALAKLGMRNPKLEEKLPDMVAKGAQRLYNFQHGDGGWGWWEADDTHPFMTAYVVYGLAKAREAGFQVDDVVLRRGVNALQQMIKARTTDKRRRYDEAPLDTRAYLVFALAEAGVTDKESLTELYERRTELSNYAKALVAIALARGARGQESRDVLANLDETAKEGANFCYWPGHSQRWHWMSHDIETTGYVLRAYVLADAKNPRIAKIVRWLAANRHGDRWHSTKDTAAVVFALSEFVAVSGELDADYTLVVKVDGRELLKARATRENLLAFDGRRVLKGVEVPAGAREITFEKEGKGSLYWAVHLKYVDAADQFEPVKSTISIERSYARVKWEGKEKVSEPLKDGDVVKSGDLIEVTLDIAADGHHEYLMVEDPLPAGFEVQKEERFHGGMHRRWRGWYARMEARDERVCIAATTMNGNHTVSYLMRAEQPGDFRILPARVFNMYVPEIAASSAGGRIRVEDVK